jgi:hypothetical protein
MQSGDFRRVQNEGIGGSSSHRTIPVKGVVLAVRLEPGTLFFRLIHQTVSTKNSRTKQSSCDSVEKAASPVTVGQQLRFAGFGFIAVPSRIILAG